MSPGVRRQPPVTVPLDCTGREFTSQFGFAPLTCRVQLFLNDVDGRPTDTSFVFDSGSSYSVIGLELAVLKRLVTPSKLGPVVAVRQTTTQGSAAARFHPGRIRAWWDDQRRGDPFDWPVLFRVHAPIDVPWIIGLGGIVPTCRWSFDGSYTSECPFGHLHLEDIR